MQPVFHAPHEIQLFGLYVPPFFLVCLIGLLGTLVVTQVLNWTGLSRCFWHPPLAFVAMWVLASSLIGTWLVAP
jgi:hypothetical protein